MEVAPLPPDQRVENEECVYCFNDVDSEDGINICLQCFTTCCKAHGCAHFVERQHGGFLSRKRITTVSDKVPEKLAIGVEGGFDDVKHTFVYELRLFDENGYQALPEDLIDNPDQIAVIDRLKQAPSASSADLLASWELKVVECPHVKGLVQEPGILKIGATVKCTECQLDKGLWLCLHCGHIGCGRRYADGSGGNNHGVDHFKATQHPVVVKLGTISPDGRADIFCYLCDESVSDSRIAEHLAPCGIDVSTSVKTESTTSEMEVDVNKNWDFNAVTQDGREFDSLVGPFSVGLYNLGNTCYANAVLHILAAIPEVVAEFTAAEYSRARWTDPRRQFFRLFDAMRGGERPAVSPRLWRSVVCHGRADFLNGQQQDAVEFFQYLFNYIKVHNPHTALLRAEFDAVQVVRCTACGDTTTIPQRDQPVAILVPPARANVDEEVTIALDELIHLSLFHDLDDRRCAKCNATHGTSTLQLKNFPDYLFVAVHLDVPVGAMVRKMNLNIGLDPQNLDLSRHQCTVAESVDEAKVAQLLDFGFTRAQAVRALQNVATVEQAIDWITENPMQQSPAVAQVMEMGFSEDEAREALEECQGNIGLAVEWLFGPRVKRTVAARSNGAPIYELVGFAQHKGTSALCGHYVANIFREGKWVLYNDRKCKVYPADVPPEFGKGYLYLWRRKQ
jgi:ubiquitin carboxyl-terminal hydrolase 5/13